MIEKNVNLLKDSKIKRIVEYSEGDKQINVLDSRFYKRNEKYYPSVTSILNYFPKNKFFHDWLKDVGHNSDIIASKAAAEGSQVHDAIDRFLNGEEIQWLNEYGHAVYSLEVWKMILKFTEFWNKHKPEIITTEYHLFSDEHEYAGTADLIVKFQEKLWLLDIKTSNSLHTSYDLQLAAYAKAWNETHDAPIERTGIIWLKAATRGEGKGEAIQGKGWQLKIIDNIESNFKMFQNIHEIYKLENPDLKPVTELLPTTVKITF
jgi:ATP-dependent exoDNAse (exonuclease V) beta subunit